MRMFGLVVWSTLFLAAVPADTQGVEEPLNYCNNLGGRHAPDLVIGGCTAVIQSGRADGPNLAIVFFNRGNIYAQQKDSSRAIADYNQTIQLNPQHAEAFNNRGVVYARQKNYSQAVADYSQAIRLKPQFVAAYSNRGKAYFDQKDYSRAIADFDQVILLNPQDTESFYSRGLAYALQENYTLAVADYSQAIRLKPKYADAYYNRGSAYYDQRDYSRAISDFDQAILFNPQHADSFHTRGLAYGKKGEYDRAIKDYSEAIRLRPNAANAYHNRGLAYAKRGEFDRAILDLSQAIRNGNEKPGTYFSRGNAHLNLGQYADALADYGEVLRLDPKHYSARQNRDLATQLQQLGAKPAGETPEPVLEYVGAGSYASHGKTWVRHYYKIGNWSAYSPQLVQVSPELPPCGKNINAARTWVDLYDEAGKRLYGFCALPTIAHFQCLWFATEIGTAPPKQVYIELIDRLKNKEYKSNMARTGPASGKSDVPDGPAICRSAAESKSADPLAPM